MNTPNNKRRKESRRKIEMAFAQLLQDREPEKISVTDICTLAQINRTTFYANYADIYALADALQQTLEEEVLGLYQTQMEARTHSYDFLPLFRHIRENQFFYRTYFKLNVGGRFRFLQFDLQQVAQIYNQPNLEYYIAFFGSGINALIKKWLEKGCPETAEELYALLCDHYLKIPLKNEVPFRDN